MIEKICTLVQSKLPLLIEEVIWDGTTFQIYGANWSFATLSVWRVSHQTGVIFGCFDEQSTELYKSLKNLKILAIRSQENILKIDPVFFLSNGHFIEVFSTDTFEPWVFTLAEFGTFVPTPCDPSNYNLSS